ncbi:aldo/keto reductase, partial [Streptomyces solisilvae]
AGPRGGPPPAPRAGGCTAQPRGGPPATRGARPPAPAGATAAAAGLPPLPDTTLDAVGDLYDRRLRAQVHHRW